MNIRMSPKHHIGRLAALVLLLALVPAGERQAFEGPSTNPECYR